MFHTVFSLFVNSAATIAGRRKTNKRQFSEMEKAAKAEFSEMEKAAAKAAILIH
ncbi:hypothetical protein LTSEWAN_0799 [Salmonella enterica subsp. enterica serovar Wandsworth str. A4-580]|uniref:Uncharacterized protein n=1 Tax=Salmonella enterica subsp. enterica serovar Wandsworth str. A4-580 TaxID=913086 RepID=G5S7J9_SALET|nr:hypothetical protein LTSEWAN_0799 [Salmonella enterica subsp. enterica serovar Wandsworth str. A4-580]